MYLLAISFFNILLAFGTAQAECEGPAIEEFEDFEGEISAEVIQQIINGTYEGELPIEELRASRKHDTVISSKDVAHNQEVVEGANALEECYIIRPQEQPIQEASINRAVCQGNQKGATAGMFREITRGNGSIGAANPVPLTAPGQVTVVGGGPSTPLMTTTAAPALIQKILKERFGVIQSPEQTAWPKATELLSF